MHMSVEASLKKLRTDYIDILYVHWWDTSVEEVMNGLHNLVVQGMVLYLVRRFRPGIPDTPAWIVSQADQALGKWSLLERSFEREIIPMARAHGLALTPWDVLASGKIRTDAEEEARRASGEKGRTIFRPGWERSEDERKMSHALEKVAAEVGAKSIQAVAIAYVMQKVPYCFPIVGGRKTEHLLANIEALNIALSKEQIASLGSVLPFSPGFPTYMIGDGTNPAPPRGHRGEVREAAISGAHSMMPNTNPTNSNLSSTATTFRYCLGEMKAMAEHLRNCSLATDDENLKALAAMTALTN
ncbi:NADP-dependent oxidoreductase domain-containing protein [Mycena pura]|uniref:NADP-dependent oxidoreductase domain-containing protein n=1 Tax=Mycena pura TaxID=153505 RepID=A0AAD6UNM0_9AGAR|nr:NADP-dependent oxidoreductase domain-containing protein [Mycena pura]